MIPIPTNKPIGIMLPSTNKALAAVLKDATPEQLAVLSQPKDIKSVLSDLLNDTLGSNRPNKVILELLKGSPLFKNLGNFTTDLKQLLVLLERDHTAANIQGALKSFIVSAEKMDEKTLQKQIADSGVFLESKIAAKADPFSSLKVLLEQTAHLLKHSGIPEAKTSERLITALLENRQLSASSTAAPEPKRLQSVVDTLKSLVAELGKVAVLSAAGGHKEVAGVMDKLESFTQERFLKPDLFSLKEVRQVLAQLTEKLVAEAPSGSKAVISENKAVSGLIEKILFKLDSLPLTETKTAPLAALFVEQKVPQDIKALIGQLQESLTVKDALSSPELAKVTEKLALFTRPGELLGGVTLKEQISTDVKALLLQMHDDIQKTDSPGSVEVSRQIDKLMVQIDYYQLLSHLSSSSYLYIPFEWELLEQGGISFQKGDKEGFYCEINLRLRDYGELKLMLNLHEEKRLDITIHTEKERLKEKFMTNKQALRAAVGAAGLMPGQIRLFDLNSTAQASQPYAQQGSYGDLDLGFEVKV